MHNLKVNLGSNSYPIFVGDGIFGKLGEMLELYGYGPTIVVITDTNVEQILRQALTEFLGPSMELADVIAIPAGERSKSMATVEKMLTRMLERHYDRNLTVLAIGGGVVGDLAGFVASIYKRGVHCIQVPTTLLAQVDSCIGGKTGVNHPSGKNLIGTIVQPKLVWADLQFLQTLPRKEIVCGLGEVVKYGIIKDAELFSICEENLDKLFELDAAFTFEIVRRSCEIKANVVSADERETGLRMILNFGHTIGHAIEAALAYKRISHGEAVLIGMLAESHIAAARNLLPRTDLERIQALIIRFDLQGKLSGLRAGEIERFIKADKKALAGKIRFVLPRAIGEVDIFDDVDPKLVQQGIDFVLELL